LSKERPYLSYLLRLWRTGTGETWTWRASLEDARTGERQGFASLNLLFAFLENETEGTVEGKAFHTESGPLNDRDERQP
jgi:hypothetical protein